MDHSGMMINDTSAIQGDLMFGQDGGMYYEDTR